MNQQALGENHLWLCFHIKTR